MDEPLIDFKALLELESIMEDEFMNLLKIYMNDSDKHIVEIERYIIENNAIEVRSHAHSLKGSSSNMFINGMVDICKSLEYQANSGDLSDAEEKLSIIKKSFNTVKLTLKERYQC